MLTFNKKSVMSGQMSKRIPIVYLTDSVYDDSSLVKIFLDLKESVADMNRSFVMKCITGSEADFLLLMQRAEEYLKKHYGELEATIREIILQMFSEAIFGYYVLTPLVKDPRVSDFKVLDWNRVTCKAEGKRYVTDISFFSRDDYDHWLSRIIAIHRGRETEEDSLQHFTDRRGSEEFFLRADIQLKGITSQDVSNIHVRKIPKKKYSWEYLKRAGMLDQAKIEYLKDRTDSGFGFLISGRGGSGKSTLLNAMLDIIPVDESVLVVQESDELYSDHPETQFEHTLSVQTKHGVKDFTLDDELRLGLLQDIDNIVIGEIKGREAYDVLITAMSTGERFFGTIHSNDAASSVRRLAQLAKYDCDYPIETLLEMTTSTPLSLIHMTHFSIDEILEVKGWDDEKKRVVFDEVYRKF